jgi:hypothetical protein
MLVAKGIAKKSFQCDVINYNIHPCTKSITKFPISLLRTPSFKPKKIFFQFLDYSVENFMAVNKIVLKRQNTPRETMKTFYTLVENI